MKVVFVDANILASKTLTDWLFFLRLANPELFCLRTSEDVLAETVRVMRRVNPRLPGGIVTARLRQIRDFVMDDLVEDFPATTSFTGSDEGDYHVHAAAIETSADVLLTQNRGTDLTAHPDTEVYEIVSADPFFLWVINENPECLQPIIASQLDYWNDQTGGALLVQHLESAGCPEVGALVARTARSAP